MKTTKEIINDELGVILNSVDYDVNNALFEINKNKKWWSEEEIRIAISEVKQWEHHDLSKDWEIELINKLFNAPDLNSRSSDEDSLNKGYEVNQK